MQPRLRIVLKTDVESTIQRGAVLHREHFEPRMARLIEGVAKATEELLSHAQVLCVTEGWRPQRDPKKRDLHTQLRALDFTIRFIRGIRATEDEYKRVAERARTIVGDAEYDFECHGEGTGFHIHGEFDPKPERGIA